jgi:ABC-type Fe3+/spermidine/putrescine transport system ATPase subunit
MTSEKNIYQTNPFPGLRPFTHEESHLFFGREGQSKEVLNRLQKHKFVTVIGASGSGKSSLIFCGVVPNLVSNISGQEKGWSVVTFRPGTDPAGNMADAITEAGLLKNKNLNDRERLLTALKEDRERLSTISLDLTEGGKKNLLIIIDQFEELFRYGLIGDKVKRSTERAAFIEMVVDATLKQDNSIFFILTMRSDFIGECAHFQGLTQLINDSNYLIPHMTRENYRAVITGPVGYVGAKIEEQLVDMLLNEVGERTDQLPVLQHALMRTWSYWQQSGQPEKPVGVSDYESVGRMANAMSRHADEAYEELDPRGKAICEVMFRAMTEKGSDNKGVRRPTDVETICAIAECTVDELYEVAEKFRIPSRSFITPGVDYSLTPGSVMDISHESLMRLWDRLRLWVDEEASSVQMYLRLSEASAMYQRGKTGLWRPPDLQLALNWREKNHPTVKWAERYNPAFERAMVYLSTSEQEYLLEEENKIMMQKRQLKRSRLTAIILGIAAIVSVGFMLFAFMKKLDADNQRNVAETQTQIAVEQEALAQKNLELATAEQQRADEEAKIARAKEEEARIERDNAEMQRQRAELNAELARQQQALAEEKEIEATNQRNIAEEKEREAVEQREKALSLRMLAVGKQMSVKSLQVEGQQDLQTLLAYQAYIFNKRYQGAPNDADIYSGLYNASKSYGGEGYRIFTGHQSEIRSIAFLPGKNVFFTAGQDGRVIRWTLDGKTDNFEVVYTAEVSIEALALSPDAEWMACGDDNAVIRMIPLNGNDVSFDLKGHSSRIKSIVFSYDGRYLYSAGLDGKVFKWDIAARTGKDINQTSVRITSIDISSSNSLLAGLSDKGEVYIWNPESGSDGFRIDAGNREITSIRFEPSANILAIGDINGLIELWDIVRREKVAEVKGHGARISSMSFNPLYNQLATASYDKTIKIWNRDDFTDPPIDFNDNANHVLIIHFSDNGESLVSAALGGSLVSRATHADILARNVCNLVTRNLTEDEWNLYVGRDIEWEKTCQEKDLNIKIERR